MVYESPCMLVMQVKTDNIVRTSGLGTGDSGGTGDTTGDSGWDWD